MDPAIAAVDAAIASGEALAIREGVECLAGVIADLVAAVATNDEGREERFRVPFETMPAMLDFFQDTFKVPTDMSMSAWRDGSFGAPLAVWRRALDAHLVQARQGVACSRIGTTRYLGQPQSNVFAIMEMLAHVLALVVVLPAPETPALDR